MSNRFEGDLSRRIRQRRQELNLTQAEVADKIGVTTDASPWLSWATAASISIAFPALAGALKLNRRQLCRQALRERAPELYRQLFRQQAA